ncbi:hypothetical protein [Burkholderia multivorans]|uniref:hypothetical protein n=1 Tax=Burkholderia multivorans TaxID=87883 RepID=UPI000A773A5F|nr:hypothetical protein [Burkholderia multivorans]
MKKLLTAVASTAAFLTSVAFAATTVPPSLINPAGSSVGQAIVSTGPSSAPMWGSVSVGGLSPIAANSVLANATGTVGVPTAFAMPSCSGANNALRWTAGAGFTCAGSIALTSNGLNQFAATTSAQLAGVVTDETGSGSLVFANGPVINNLSATGSLTGFVGRLLNVQVFTANGTYTPTSGTAKVIVTVQAPGGGSGAVPATAAGQSAAASGGGAGSYAKALITSGFSGVTITAPGGGAAGAAGANNGGAGSTASFGSIVSCPGGNPGQAGVASSSTGFTTAAAQASACTVTGATVLLSVPGQASTAGAVIVPGAISIGGAGGSSPVGIARNGYLGNGSGIGPTGYGAGGTGANNAASQPAAAGTAGGGTYIQVEEYSN